MGACLMQGGLRSVKKHDTSPASCFQADLTADAAAVPKNAESAATSSAQATIVVTAATVTVNIDWQLPGIDSNNTVIGLHIHEGNCTTNGAILVGFCGQDPLPAFSGPCQQDEDVKDYTVEGKACDIVGGPCANPEGNATIAQAADTLISNSADSSKVFYINLHTKAEFDVNGALGLIRGQLQAAECP